MMKKGFIGLILCGQMMMAYADNAPSSPSPMQMLATQTPPASTPTTPPSTETANTVSAVSSTPLPGQTVSASPAAATEAPTSIDCTYTLTQPFSTISADTIIQWANHAAVQTFSYDFQNYDKQFKVLKNCYTTAGWASFMEALKVSNNLKATQDEHLFVSAQVNGESQLVSQVLPSQETASTDKPSQQPTWIVRVPLKVTYQNQDREVSQDMYVDLTIKTVYGIPARFGINQIIASPKTAATEPSASAAGVTPPQQATTPTT